MGIDKREGVRIDVGVAVCILYRLPPSNRFLAPSWAEPRFRVHKGLVSAPARKVRRIASRAVMFDDVTDDVCRGCLLIALPSKTGPDIDNGESTWS